MRQNGRIRLPVNYILIYMPLYANRHIHKVYYSDNTAQINQWLQIKNKNKIFFLTKTNNRSLALVNTDPCIKMSYRKKWYSIFTEMLCYFMLYCCFYAILRVFYAIYPILCHHKILCRVRGMPPYFQTSWGLKY